MLKLIRNESESATAAEYVNALKRNNAQLATSWLGETEVRRGIKRHQLTAASAEAMLASFHSFEVTREIFDRAAGLDGENLRTLDALHIAIAQRAEAGEFITYDARQAAVARAAGLTVTSPGAA